jgi:hypothetical protein
MMKAIGDSQVTMQSCDYFYNTIGHYHFTARGKDNSPFNSTDCD